MMNVSVRRSWIFLFLALALAAPVIGQTSVTLTPTKLSFANQVEGTTSAAKIVTLQNIATATLSITSITVSANFTRTGGTCRISPPKLAKGASCTINIAFSPNELGSLRGTLTVIDSAGTQSTTLTGIGIAPVVVSPTSLSFAKLPEGETSSPQTVTLTNNQSKPLTIASIAASTNFTQTSTCPISPATLAGGGNCAIMVYFAPTTTGPLKGTLTVTDIAVNSPTVALSGTGLAPVLQSITLTPTIPNIYLGATLQFTATGNYSNNTTKNLSAAVTWTTNPTGIASVGAGGLATGLSAGSTAVEATLGAFQSNLALLTVMQVFVPTGSLTTARYYHSATLLTTGIALAAGGIGPVPGGTGALGELASAELYNPGTGVFTPTAVSLNTARDQHSASLLNNGSVLIAGGSGGDGELASAELYNPTTAAFTYTGYLTTARYEHTATVLPDGTVLIAGGYGSAGVLASAEIYSPATGQFNVATGALNDARFGATATLLPTGMVLIAGGANLNGPLSSAELYDPAMQTFTPTTNLNVARSSATATLLNTGKVLIADGYDYLTTGPLTSAEIYDPIAGTFTPTTGNEAATGWLGTATLIGDGTVLIAGSAENSAIPEVYAPSTGTFSVIEALNTPRDLQTATTLPNGNVLIAGGHSNVSNSVLAAAELYEPLTLTPANLSSITIAPSSPSLAVGGSQQMIATGTFNDNSTQQLVSVVWTSSNPAVATVTNDITNSGVVYGVAAGATQITACTGTFCSAQPVTVNVTGGTDVRR
jgi:hypothetical protein